MRTLRYERREGDGEWVTINGVHVMIGKDGTIEKGPKDFIGKTPSQIGAKSDPEKLKEALSQWTKGGAWGGFAEQKAAAENAIKSGNPESNQIVLGIRENTYDGDIHRGIVLGKQDPLLQVKAGDKIQLMPQSFSTNRGVALKFLNDAKAPGSKVETVLTVHGPVNGIRPQERYETLETEVISAGHFEVQSIGREKLGSLGKMRTVIHLKQTGVF